MSEEISNPALNVPRSIVTSILVNGSLGFGMLIATIFCIGDVDEALAAASTIGFSFIEIFLQAVDSTGGATGMTCIVIALTFSATIGFLATSSRMIWSFARDKRLPFSNLISQVRCLLLGFLFGGHLLFLFFNVGQSALCSPNRGHCCCRHHHLSALPHRYRLDRCFQRPYLPVPCSILHHLLHFRRAAPLSPTDLGHPQSQSIGPSHTCICE